MPSGTSGVSLIPCRLPPTSQGTPWDQSGTPGSVLFKGPHPGLPELVVFHCVIFFYTVFQEKLANIIKADILDVLDLISLAKIQCNQSYDLNIGFSSYQIVSPYVKKRHGEELDKKIRKKFQTILKIHTTDHGGKKHRHCTKEKADAIIDLMQVINTI